MFFLVGWIGTSLYLLNHAYLSLNQQWNKQVYYGGNAIAALCLVVSSFVASSWQAVMINVFWAVISIILIVGVDLSRLRITSKPFNALVFGLSALVIIGYILSGSISLALLAWASVLIFSGCYLLFSANKISEVIYLTWNTIAATIIIPELFAHQNWPVVFLEVCWACISLYGILRRMYEYNDSSLKSR
jgi:hypothetical protein